MHQICLIGSVDKRFVLYPLIRILDLMGKTLVISNNGVLRHFAEDYSTRFNWGNTDFLISPIFTKDFLASQGVSLGVYDYVIYDTVNELPEGMNTIVYCHGVDKSFCTEDVLAVLEDLEHTEVIITTSQVKDKDKIKLILDKADLEYVWSCEEQKMFLPCKNRKLVDLVSQVFSRVIGASKDDFAKFLMRDDEV